MSRLFRLIFAMLAGALAMGAVLWHLGRPAPPEPPTFVAIERPGVPLAPPTSIPLSPLATPPDWTQLSTYQSSVTRKTFLKELESVYALSPDWRDFFHFGNSEVLIETGVPGHLYRLRLGAAGREQARVRPWRGAFDLPPAPAGLPLKGLHIAIDPGHIGGSWAKMEERWFQLGDDQPVAEGDMTLTVARLLIPRLEALGAEVTLVRDAAKPVTTRRPADLLHLTEPPGDLAQAERLFYRTAEIRARAKKINETILPDLVIALHFNATAWGNPSAPTLASGHHFHLLMNGAYTADELGLADQRHALARRILTGAHREEAALGHDMAAAFAKITGLPPYLYEPNSTRAVNVDGNPYLWARNLLANRLYHAPVIYLEPYVMNSVEDYPRIQAGDYMGLREINGQPRPSLFQEYADAVTRGLSDYYSKTRPVAVPAAVD